MEKLDLSDIKVLFAEVAEQLRLGSDEIRLNNEQMRLNNEQQRIRGLELDRRLDKTEKMIKQLGKQFGEMGNAQGDYTEAMVWPSAQRVLKRKFNLEHVFQCAHKKNNLTNKFDYEYDVFGYANGEVNTAVIAEIKGNAKEDSVDQLLAQLEKFPRVYPEHRGKKLYGALAAVNVPDNVRGMLRKKGLYLICPRGKTFGLVNMPDFQPKDFQAK